MCIFIYKTKTKKKHFLRKQDPSNVHHNIPIRNKRLALPAYLLNALENKIFIYLIIWTINGWSHIARTHTHCVKLVACLLINGKISYRFIHMWMWRITILRHFSTYIRVKRHLLLTFYWMNWTVNVYIVRREYKQWGSIFCFCFCESFYTFLVLYNVQLNKLRLRQIGD